MQRDPLRLCPFYANLTLKIVVAPENKREPRRVTCTECGAMGPIAWTGDPPGHAEYLWNLRYGKATEH
jgi:hypothetical protein